MRSHILIYSDPTRPVGIADVVAFGQFGTSILRNSINPVVQLASPIFGVSSGWTPDRHLRFVADATGDGAADIIGFGDAGVYIAPNNGRNAFADPQLVIQQFAIDAGGWTIDENPRFVADLRKTGRVDLLGFGDAGVYVSLNDGNLAFTDISFVLNAYGIDAGNWTTERHLRFLADANGDGYPDIIGFGEQDIFVSLGNGDGSFQAPNPVLQAFTIGSGNWTIDSNPRFVADLTGDGKVDIIGFGDAGVYVSLNNGDGTFGNITFVLATFGTDQGWQVDQHPRFIADLNGDGRGDIIGFGDAGVYTSLGNGDGTFQPAQFVLADYGYDAGGWRVDQHPRFVADFTGDGFVDIIGFGQNATAVSFGFGNGSFALATTLVDNFAVAQGWEVDLHVRNPANLYA